jgi:hypothetical protein
MSAAEKTTILVIAHPKPTKRTRHKIEFYPRADTGACALPVYCLFGRSIRRENPARMSRRLPGERT